MQQDPAGGERIAAMRRSYQRARLSESELAGDWLTQFRRWLDEAVGSLAFPEPNAMVIGTADPAGVPSVRTVLLKGYDEDGLVFFTNYASRKGQELAANPRISAVFPWYALERQVIVCGSVTRTSREESERYFHSRPYGSQIAASVGRQSQVIPDREWLDSEAQRLAQVSPDEVPLPEFWGGYRIEPETVEFWQGRESRLHDRLRYRRTPTGAWVIERLAP